MSDEKEIISDMINKAIDEIGDGYTQNVNMFKNEVDAKVDPNDPTAVIITMDIVPHCCICKHWEEGEVSGIGFCEKKNQYATRKYWCTECFEPVCGKLVEGGQ